MITASSLVQLVIDLSKATFDNFYFSAATIQTMVEDRASALAHAVCPASCPIPGLVDECTGLLRRTRADVKHTVDRCVLLIAVPLRGEVAAVAPAVAPAASPGKPRAGARRTRASAEEPASVH